MYSVSAQKDPNDNTAIEIVFSGELLIDHIENIVAEARGILGDYDSYLISAKEVDDMDLSFLQFVFSLETTLQAQNKKVEKNLQIPETFSELFTNTGFDTIIA